MTLSEKKKISNMVDHTAFQNRTENATGIRVKGKVNNQGRVIMLTRFIER